jgi:hypothetical protein
MEGWGARNYGKKQNSIRLSELRCRITEVDRKMSFL